MLYNVSSNNIWKQNDQQFNHFRFYEPCENSKPHFWHNTKAFEDVSPYKVWLQKAKWFKRFSLDK